MSIDPYRLVVFFHVLMFCYWLGADLGVWLCGRAARRPGISDEARALVRKVGHLIDMGPRSALVLIFPAGLILASQYGSPVQGLGLVAAVLACGVWLWMVWTIYLQPQTPLGRTVWKIDLGFRALLMVTLIGFGVSCLVTGGPIQDRWLAAKIVVFGLILLTGIFLRIALFRMAQQRPRVSDRQQGAGRQRQNHLLDLFAVGGISEWLVYGLSAARIDRGRALEGFHRVAVFGGLHGKAIGAAGLGFP